MSDTRGEYRAGDTSQPDNVRVLPLAERRGFTQTDNAYFDGLFGRVSPTAYYCLMYIMRNTAGYHRPSVRLSFKQLGDALGMSRNTAMKGVQELEAAHIVGSDGSERGRTQVRAYFLLPIEDWTLNTACPTSAKTALDETSPKTALVVSKIGLVGGQTSAKIGHLINKERNKVSKEKIDANASSAACAVAPSPAVTSKQAPELDAQPQAIQTPSGPLALPQAQPRKRSAAASKPRQLSAKDEYRVALLQRVEQMAGRKPPNRDQEWAAAARFYTWTKDGQPADIEQVAACYGEEMRRPAWDSKYLSLHSVFATFGAYLRSPANYRKAIDRARAAADGTLVKTSPARTAPYAAAQVEPPAYAPSSANDIWKQ